jgi:archaeal flagellar protein FlaH
MTQQTVSSQNLLSVHLSRDELNRSIGGGIPARSVVLLEGADGTGKSLLAQRIAYGLIQNKSTVSYLSTELDTQGFVEQMSSLDYDIKYDMLDEKLFFISLFPYYGQGRLQKNFLDILLRSKKLFSNDVIVFDTLSFLLVDDQLSSEDAFSFLQFLKRLNGLGKTIILAVDPEHLNSRLLTLLRSSCDVIFDLELRTFAGQMVRVVNVKRFKRSGGEVLGSIPFRVEPGKGLVIEIVTFS